MYKADSRGVGGIRPAAAAQSPRSQCASLFHAQEQNVRHLLPLCFVVLLATGCDSPSAEQPLPTVDREGTLTVPADYAPGPKTDLSRVDCPQYLAMTPVEMRNEMKALCAQSTTPEARARNPMCEAQRITDHCERSEKAARS
jgi:hypothetical protein